MELLLLFSLMDTTHIHFGGWANSTRMGDHLQTKAVVAILLFSFS